MEKLNKAGHKKELLNSLKSIIETAQNNMDELYIDDIFISHISYKQVEISMNYIRVCTQKVQYHMKNYTDSPCIDDNM